MMLRILKIAGKYKKEMIFSAMCLLLASVLNLVTPEVVRRMTSELSSGVMTVDSIVRFSVILTAAYAVRGVLRFGTMYVSHIAAWKFVGEITLKVYGKLQTLSLKYYHDKQTGQLMSRMINDTRMLEVLIAHSLPDLIGNLVLIAGVIVMIFSINPALAALTMIPVPLVLIAGSIFSKKVAPLFKINQEVLGDLGGSAQDYLSGMKEIQAFCAEESQYERMKKMCAHYSFVNIRANFANGIFHPSVEFLTAMGTVIVVGAGGALALGGAIDVSDVVGFFMYLGLFYAPLTALVRLFEDVNSAFAGASRMFEILDAESDIKDASGAVSIGRGKGAVEFENVSFAYKEGATILDNVSFKINPGEMYAFVGPTGVGKTTAVSLIERFYDPTAGRILIDGQDIKDVTVKSLRENISLVLQDVFLFNGTIAENIAFGEKNATRGDIERAAKIAKAEEFILGTEMGYDTVVGERGMKLSGGQKQRISIARAVLRDTPILILDEATSAVDTETEADIREAIDALTGTRTIIVVAHRLSTVKKADKIIVFENGIIAESGTHNELIEKDGVYSKMANI